MSGRQVEPPHSISIDTIKYGYKTYDIDGDEIVEGFVVENEESRNVAHCICGETFDNPEDAEEHMREKYGL